MLVPLLLLFAQQPPQRAADLAASGWRHYEKGQLAEAERDLAEAARLAPSNAPIALALGQVVLAAGKQKLAIPHLERASRGLGNPPDVRFTLAQAYQAVDDDTRALQVLMAEPPAGPLREPWLFSRGFSLFRLGRLDSAENTFRRLLKNPEMAAPAAFFLANCAYARGKYADSLPLYRQAIAAGDIPDNRAANAYHHNHGLALFQLRRFEEGAEAFQKSIERYPLDAMPFLFLGRCRAELGSTSLAIEALEKAIALEPSFRLAYYQLARLHTQSGDKQRAEELFQKVAALRDADLAKEEDIARRLKVGR